MVECFGMKSVCSGHLLLWMASSPSERRVRVKIFLVKRVSPPQLLQTVWFPEGEDRVADPVLSTAICYSNLVDNVGDLFCGGISTHSQNFCCDVASSIL